MENVRFFDNGKCCSQLAFASAAASAGQPADDAGTGAAVEAFRASIESRPFVAVSVADCPQCEELAAMLALRGVPAEVFVKWDRAAPEYQHLKEALSEFAGGAFTFPQVFADGQYQGGFQDVVESARTGTFDELFEREFDAEPQTVRRWVEKMPIVSFSLPNCPQCDTLREDLKRRGVPVDEVFIKLDRAKPQYSSLKAQLQKLTGLSTFSFPQTFVSAEYAGNFDEVMKKADAGEFNTVLQESFGIAPATQVSKENVQIAFDDDF